MAKRFRMTKSEKKRYGSAFKGATPKQKKLMKQAVRGLRKPKGLKRSRNPYN